MANYAPYVIVLFDSILLSIISQQVWFRYRVYRKYAHIELVREQVVHKRKDIYRIAICSLLIIKTTHSFLWLLYEGWATVALFIKPWIFWAFYGVLLSISVLLKGDFAAVVVAIEQNIARNGKKKAFWRGILMGSAVLSAILTMWGIVLSIEIKDVPIWQYMGFCTSLLNGFITYKMLNSIISTTRETQESTYHVRQSITAKEFEKQLFTLFHMKQMAVALLFIGLYAIYAFCVNIYYMVHKRLILQPFIGNDPWYLYTKLMLFNLYLYSMAGVFLMYTWISYTNIREAAIKADRVGKLCNQTPDNGENDVVVLPDPFQMIYAPNIDPNDPENQYTGNGGTITDTEDIYAYNPITQMEQTPNETVEVALDPSEAIDNENGATAKDKLTIDDDNSPTDERPTSPASKLSVMSTSVAEDQKQCDTIDIIPLFGHKISIRHRAESSYVTDINVEGFIQESNKARPHATMFDMNIAAMKLNGSSLERIYFDAQRFRGITPKSLKLTRKMRSISYSRNRSLNHSRRNTMNSNTPQSTASTTPKKGLLNHSQSVPNVRKSVKKADKQTQDDLSTDSQLVYHTELQSKYSHSETESENSQSVKYKLKRPNPQMQVVVNAHPLSMTVPEDAVLTPNKDGRDSFEIKMKQPQEMEEVLVEQKVDTINFVIVDDNNDNSKSEKYEESDLKNKNEAEAIHAKGNNGSNGSNASESNLSITTIDSEEQMIPPSLGFSKVQIYSNSAN